MASLVMRLRGTDQVVALREDTRIGRHPENDVQVLDTCVSKFHCLVRKESSGWVVLDLDSSNGSFHNYQRFEGERRLEDRDVIGIGDTQIRFVDLSPDQIDDELLATLTADLLPVAIHPDVDASTDEVWEELRRLRQLDAACRAVLACKDVPMLMDVALIAAKELGDATSARIKLRHASGAMTEKSTGPPSDRPEKDESRRAPVRSGVMRITGGGKHEVATELSIPIRITGSGRVQGLLALERKGAMRHFEHSLLTTVCDLISVVLASLQAR
jgi:hypothetical protein